MSLYCDDFYPLLIKPEDLENDDFMKELLSKDIEEDDHNSTCSMLEKNLQYDDTFDMMFARNDDSTPITSHHEQHANETENQYNSIGVQYSNHQLIEPLKLKSYNDEQMQGSAICFMPSDLSMPPMNDSYLTLSSYSEEKRSFVNSLADVSADQIHSRYDLPNLPYSEEKRSFVNSLADVSANQKYSRYDLPNLPYSEEKRSFKDVSANQKHSRYDLPNLPYSEEKRSFENSLADVSANQKKSRYDLPNLPSEKSDEGEKAAKEGDIKDGVLISSLLQLTDRMLVTDFTNAVVDEMHVTSFSRRDRKGKRSSFATGYPGISCRHCDGRIGRTGRYFPSSIKTISDSKKSLYAMHKHIASCVKCPDHVKHNVDSLFCQHIEERKTNKRQGTQRAYFRKIWQTLHPVDHACVKV
jgi:hypothetical protein